MSAEKSTFQAIYETDVSQFLKETDKPTKDGKTILTLPWSTAHRLMQDIDPNYSWEFERDVDGCECHYYRNGTAEVRIKMTVCGKTVHRSYPVHNNWESIKNPSSTEIHTAKQRCRVATMAEFGLNLRNYEEIDVIDDEETTSSNEPVPQKKEKTIEQQIDEIWSESGINDAENYDASKRIYDRFKRALRNRGFKDYEEDRFIKFIANKGFTSPETKVA